MKSILDPSFPYVHSYNTDLRKRFAQLRDEQRDRECEPWFDASAFERPTENVRQLKARTA